jgi:Ca2+-binding RTX toxin-like protein
MVYGNENSIINFGTIVAVDDAIATVADLVSPTGSTVVNSGTVQSQTLAAVYLANDLDSLTNSGSLLSAKDIAVVLDGPGQHVTNEGLIKGELGGIQVNGFQVEILNRGEIVSDGIPFLGPTPFSGYGVGFASGSFGVLTNDGTIRGGFAGVWSDTGTAIFVTNTGNISGLYVGVGALSGSSSSSFIANSGTISGLEASIVLGDGNDHLINSGTLMGDVDLGAGDDVIDTRHGDVLTSAVSSDGAGAGSIIGGDGSDTYLIGDADINLVEAVGVVGDVDKVKTTVSYQLETNFEDLTLLGSRSINGMGNASGNTITGNSGDNRLYGFGGFDHLYGGAGDDVLYGGAGYADVLYGGAGDDVLIGGAGRDWMFGGADADRFVYLSASNTGPTESTSDSISDFVSGEDLVDLSRIDAIRGNGAVNDAFTFIDGNAFSGVAGELRFTASGTNTLIEFDQNGDSVADGTIRLFGAVTLTVFDFVL